MTKTKFQIGQIVDFVNDYGVKFPNKKIIKIEFIDNVKGESEPRYHYEGSDTPSFPAYERNLRAIKA